MVDERNSGTAPVSQVVNGTKVPGHLQSLPQPVVRHSWIWALRIGENLAFLNLSENSSVYALQKLMDEGILLKSSYVPLEVSMICFGNCLEGDENSFEKLNPESPPLPVFFSSGGWKWVEKGSMGREKGVILRVQESKGESNMWQQISRMYGYQEQCQSVKWTHATRPEVKGMVSNQDGRHEKEV